MLKCGHVTKGSLVIKAWTYELLNKKDVIYDLAGQKQVWLLDLQVDETGERIHIAGGIGQQRVCNLKVDMAQYSLQYFQLLSKGEIRQRECLEIILPKAHVEERLFSTPCDCIYRWRESRTICNAWAIKQVADPFHEQWRSWWHHWKMLNTSHHRMITCIKKQKISFVP